MTLKDIIKSGEVEYKANDVVVVFRRKPKGHPRAIEDNVDYTILGVQTDGHIVVRKHSNDGHGWMQPIKVHKTYMIHKNILRDFKIESILNE